MKGVLLGLVKAASIGVRLAAVWSACLLFLAVSAAQEAGAHIPMGVAR